MCGDCDLVAHPVGVLPVVSGRTLHREKRVFQDQMQSAEWATASMPNSRPSHPHPGTGFDPGLSFSVELKWLLPAETGLAAFGS
jgi:hypothetical protein